MTRARILGIGQVSACGAGVETLRRALAGEAPRPARVPGTGSLGGESVPVFLTGSEGLEALVDPRRVRRLDEFSRKFLLAALHARQDAGVDLADPERVGVVVATGYGPLVTSFAFLDDVIREGDELGSPFLFSSSVHNAPASTLAAILGLRGPAITVTAFAHAWARALEVAMGWLDSETVDQVVLAAGDEYHELIAYELRSRGGWPEDGLLRPLEFERCTYVPGETFVATLLGRPGEGPAAWGHLEAPRFFEPGGPEALEPPPGPVFLAAKGDQAAGPAYLAIAAHGEPVAAYSSLWGANPTCDAMTAVAAAITLRVGVHFDVPFAGDAPPATEVIRGGTACRGAIASCISCDRPGEGVLVAVHRGDAPPD